MLQTHLPSPLINKASLRDYWPWSLKNPLVRPWVGLGWEGMPLNSRCGFSNSEVGCSCGATWSTVRSMGSCLGPTRSGIDSSKENNQQHLLFFLARKQESNRHVFVFIFPFLSSQLKNLHSPKLIWPLNIGIFRGYVSFRDSTLLLTTQHSYKKPLAAADSSCFVRTWSRFL